jgi:secondary thiamine-phosphate synthase enzyme
MERGVMRQAQLVLTVTTRGKGLTDITGQVTAWAAAQAMQTGLLTLWCKHTSASLTVQENADPSVRADILRYFDTLAPEEPGRYAHEDEGPDDMPAHLRTMLTATQLSVPLVNGELALGVWQALYVFEHRRGGHRREVVLHLLGD